MDKVEEIDVEQIMADARQSIARRGIAEDSPVCADVRPGVRRGQAASDLSYLHAAADIQNIPLTSHRPVVGSVVVAVKKVLQQLLTPILNRQVAYNSASALALTQTREELAALDLRQAQAAQTAESLARQVDVLLRAQVEAGDTEARLRARSSSIRSSDIRTPCARRTRGPSACSRPSRRGSERTSDCCGRRWM